MKHSFAQPPLQSSTTFSRDRRKYFPVGSPTDVLSVRVPEKSAEVLALCAHFDSALTSAESMKSDFLQTGT
jgi:hypothetical protein